VVGRRGIPAPFSETTGPEKDPTWGGCRRWRNPPPNRVRSDVMVITSTAMQYRWDHDAYPTNVALLRGYLASS